MERPIGAERNADRPVPACHQPRLDAAHVRRKSIGREALARRRLQDDRGSSGIEIVDDRLAPRPVVRKLEDIAREVDLAPPRHRRQSRRRLGLDVA